MLAVAAVTFGGGALAAVGGQSEDVETTVGDWSAAARATGASATVGPDVTVLGFDAPVTYGPSGGFLAYSVGTTSCNRGDAPLEWCRFTTGCAPGAGQEDHPVIAQNLYRLRDGRFEQIGVGWLKHGFGALNQGVPGCTGAGGGGCVPPPAGYFYRQLGVGCVDPYTADTNAWQPLGRRSDVDATTGLFPYPYTSPSDPYELYDQRLKVALEDIDASLNPGASYWAEVQYVASDDAAAGNGLNNASHQQVTIGAAPGYAMALAGGTFVEAQPAIAAWRAQDPAVFLADVDLAGPIVERFQVARKVTALGGGFWRYEYAVRNHNSDRAARSFTVTFPAAATFANVGFKDIDSHSGELYATTDWTSATTGTAVSWATDTFDVDVYANALRWATMYNFWFDANRPPTSGGVNVQHTIELFEPGSPAGLTFDGFNDLFRDGFEAGSSSAWDGQG